MRSTILLQDLLHRHHQRPVLGRAVAFGLAGAEVNPGAAAQAQAPHQAVEVAVADRVIHGVGPALLRVPAPGQHVVVGQGLVQRLPPVGRANVQPELVARHVAGEQVGIARRDEGSGHPGQNPTAHL